MSDNLRFYAMGAEPPKEALKDFRSETGFQGTDINAMWRIKVLTQMFGPVGIGWYTEVVRFRQESGVYGDHEDRIFCDLNLYVRDPETREWSKPISGTGGNRMWTWKWNPSHTERVWLPYDDCYKAAETDALGSACKKLGIGAKIYWNQDRSKYTLNEDGSVDVHQPTDAEVKAEVRAEKLEKMRGDAFFGSPLASTPDTGKSVDDTTSQESEAVSDAVRARMDALDVKDAKVALAKFRQANPTNEILCGYLAKCGAAIGRWPDAKVKDCYLDLVDAGAIQ